MVFIIINIHADAVIRFVSAEMFFDGQRVLEKMRV